MSEHIVATFAAENAANAAARDLDATGIPASSIRRYRPQSTLMFAISSSRHRKSLLVCSSGSAWPPLGKAGGTIMKRRLIML